VDLSQFGLPSGEMPGGTAVRGRSMSTTPNASGIREYLAGDALNRIHWGATARYQRLMVKEFELDPTSNIWIVLDLDRAVHLSAPPVAGGAPRPVGDTRMLHVRGAVEPTSDPDAGRPIYLDPETEEYAVTIAASLAAHFIQQGRDVGLLATAHHPVIIDPERGARQLVKLLRTLAVVRAEDPLPLAQMLVGQSTQFGRGDSLVVITPSVSETWVAALNEITTRGARATAILIEPHTFGSGQSSIMTVGALAAVDIPSYLVKRDDTLELVLSREMAHGHLR
jgi:uncharacterized protein (DUF58 family)